MFKNLANLSYKRNFVESIGFYVAYFIFATIIFALIGVIASVICGALNSIGAAALSPFKVGKLMGAITAVIICTIVSYKIMEVKKLFSNFGTILLFLLSILFSAIGGVILGLIPVSILSSLDSKNDNEIKQEQI